MTDRNTAIIEEFRTNGGTVGGMFEGSPMLILHTVGAKTGAPRMHPLVYQHVGEGYAIFASKAGADTNPAWFHNLVANPEASVEVGTETVNVTARVASADEREPIWERQKHGFPRFAEYERNTDRVIPVIILEPRA